MAKHSLSLQETKDDSLRQKIIDIAQQEIGVQEKTGNNDGDRVEEYLRYTDLGKGYAWCSAFVSWCYGQTGLPEPRNPWSPALFPNARTYCRGDACRRPITLTQINPADIFGIYGQSVRRINHVGLIKDIQGKYLRTIEGNSNNRVESKRRHLFTVHALADWIGGGR
ncbi:peptidoglycan-binding protein [Sphingobacterium gobiense]|uniref:Peptidoglycan-binding protein n=1 Tax=Sphingobacterium gobiense TaxID=1382456 RepID=A0A2S9JNL9_9SPHI|nr:peptidoglycan-binding protein [Sphingobacterium gobiense]